MFFLEDLRTLAIWLVVLIFVLNLIFLVFILHRRLSHQRYFAEKDAVRDRFRPTIDDFANGGLTLETAAADLATAKSSAERSAVDDLLRSRLSPKSVAGITRLYFVLGYVEKWGAEAFGRKSGAALVRQAMAGQEAPDKTKPRNRVVQAIRSIRIFAVPRAIAVDSLGRLAQKNAHIFLAEALGDPSGIVRRIAIEKMGRNQYPEAVPLLVHELERGLTQHNDVSLRSMKAALVSYDLKDLELFIPFLYAENRRARFFVIDTVREICNLASRKALLTKNDFSPALCKAVEEKCVTDEFEDVRARCAYVIRHFRDRAALESLRSLIHDENEFVRMHALRACANRFFVELIPDVLTHVVDKKWKVREAAVSALTAMGARGREELYRFFAECDDRFAGEQITEELQRNGLIPDLVAHVAQGGGGALTAQAVIRKIVSLEKTSLLLSQMERVESPEAKLFLMDTLSGRPSDAYIAMLYSISYSSSGNVRAKSRQLLRKMGVEVPDYPSGSSADQGSSPDYDSGSAKSPSGRRISTPKMPSSSQPPKEGKD